MSGSPISPHFAPGAPGLASNEPFLSVDERERLIRSATAASAHAHAPYSRFQVGAALLAADGQTFAGCNVENASYSLTLCAERVAAATAIAAGCRDWRAIAIASPGGVTPCGACRQFLAEFSAGLIVITVNVLDGSLGHFRLAELLPHSFGRQSLPVATTNGLGESSES
jgi:cytidine deaminase